LNNILKKAGPKHIEKFVEEAFNRAKETGDTKHWLHGEDLIKATLEAVGSNVSDNVLSMYLDMFKYGKEDLFTDLRKVISKIPPDQAERILLPRLRDKSVPIEERRGIAGALYNMTGTLKEEGRKFSIDGLKEVKAGFSEDIARAEKEMQEKSKRLKDLYQLRALTYRDKDLLPPTQERMLANEIKYLEESLKNTQKNLEKRASKITSFLSDPVMNDVLSKLPEKEMNDLVGSALEGLEKTKAGQRFFDDHIKPTLDGTEENPLWGQAYKSTDFGLNLVGKFSSAVVRAGEVNYLNTMARILKIKDVSKLSKVEEILVNYRKTKNSTHAVERLKNLGLFKKMSDSKIVSTLGKLGDTFAVMNFALGMHKLFKDPSLKNILSSSRDGAIMIEGISRLVKESSHFAKFGKLVGKAVPPLDIVLGSIGMSESIDRGDVAGTVFSTLTTVGGIVATAGLVLDGTVVGAVAGIPLTVIGGIMAVVGSIGNWIFSDSEAEKFAKKVGYLPD